jgi:hypothetical protein
MITTLPICLDESLLKSTLATIPVIDFKLTINQPTGNFFYDPWTISSKFKGTVWEQILNMLPENIGEARLIKLSKKECYTAHADIDNRWHLPLVLGNSYLIDLDNDHMHKLVVGQWHYMNAGCLHSAVNFGGEDRIQLVVRELLIPAKLTRFKHITIRPKIIKANSRYTFDNVYSSLLNKLNYAGLIANFTQDETSVSFDVAIDVELPTHNEFEIV